MSYSKGILPCILKSKASPQAVLIIYPALSHSIVSSPHPGAAAKFQVYVICLRPKDCPKRAEFWLYFIWLHIGKHGRSEWGMLSPDASETFAPASVAMTTPATWSQIFSRYPLWGNLKLIAASPLARAPVTEHMSLWCLVNVLLMMSYPPNP